MRFPSPWLEPYLERSLDEAYEALSATTMPDVQAKQMATALGDLYRAQDPRVQRMGVGGFTTRARQLLAHVLRDPNLSASAAAIVVMDISAMMTNHGTIAQREAILALNEAMENPAWPFWQLTGEGKDFRFVLATLMGTHMRKIADGIAVDERDAWFRIVQRNLPYLIGPEQQRAYKRFLYSSYHTEWEMLQRELVKDMRANTEWRGLVRWFSLTVVLNEEVQRSRLGLRQPSITLLGRLAEEADVPLSFFAPAYDPEEHR